MIYVYAQYTKSREDFDIIRKEHFPILQIADKNLLLLETMKKSFQDAITANEASWFSLAQENKTSIEQNLISLQKFHSLQNSKEIQEMADDLNDFYFLSLKISKQMIQEDTDNSYDDTLVVAFEQARVECDKEFSDFKSYQINLFNQTIDTTNEKRKSIVYTAFVLGLITFVTVIILTSIISLRTRDSLRALLQSVHNMVDENPDFS
ncbi:hypothetical protein [Sulfurimonas sp.]